MDKSLTNVTKHSVTVAYLFWVSRVLQHIFSATLLFHDINAAMQKHLSIVDLQADLDCKGFWIVLWSLACADTGCTKKNVSQRFVSYSCSRRQILLFHICFRIIILSSFHLDIQTMPILNLKCLKNVKKHARTYDFLPILGH